MVWEKKNKQASAENEDQVRPVRWTSWEEGQREASLAERESP